MKYLFDILVLLIIAVIIVFGELHLKMERNRAIAEQCLKNLTKPLDAWISCAEKILTVEHKSASLSADLVEAINYYKALNKKQLFERPDALNQIHRLIKLIVANEEFNEAIIALGKELTHQFALFVDTVDKYNLSVYRLDLQLNKTLFCMVGKISRFKKLDSIVNLTVL